MTWAVAGQDAVAAAPALPRAAELAVAAFSWLSASASWPFWQLLEQLLEQLPVLLQPAAALWVSCGLPGGLPRQQRLAWHYTPEREHISHKQSVLQTLSM